MWSRSFGMLFLTVFLFSCSTTGNVQNSGRASGPARGAQGSQEYTITCTGTVEGSIRVQRESSGKVVITPALTKGGFSMNNGNCSLVPVGIYLYVGTDTESIVIEGDTATTTTTDGRWFKWAVADGHMATITNSSGGVDWLNTAVEGNVTTVTDPHGIVFTKIADGNTVTTTWADGSWARETIADNTKTTIFSAGDRDEEIIDRYGNTISIYRH